MKFVLLLSGVLLVGICICLFLRKRQFIDGALVSDSRSPKSPIRDTLYGDMPFDQWVPKTPTADAFPWSQFAEAHVCIQEGKEAEAIQALRKVLDTDDLEPRFYLQAWHFLRPLGYFPDDLKANEVLGVVVEMPIEDGLDIIAAYTDHSARYYNFSGAGVVWEHPDDSLNEKIDQLIHAAAPVVENIGSWDGPRPEPPPKGQIRISFLTPGGISFGQGPFEDLSADPLATPVIDSAFDLMKALIAKADDS